jgi:AraC-like DNA-binding protein
MPRFPILHTTNPELFRSRTCSELGATQISVRKTDSFRAWGRFIRFQDISIGSGGSNSGIAFEFPEVDYVRQQIAVRGRGITTSRRVEYELNREQSCLTAANQRARLAYEEDHERVTLRVKTEALMQKLSMLLGARPKGTIEFEATTKLNHPNAQILVGIVQSLQSLIDSTEVELGSIVIRELEQAIVVAFLCANQNTFSSALEQDAKYGSPNNVRRAEDYIEANWNKPISVDELVSVTNISARSLFRSFKAHRGYSPMAFAKMVRLRNAKRMLDSAEPNLSVTGVAFGCGFGNPGHFAKDYQLAFGERPSETLARARGVSTKLPVKKP